MVVNALCVHPWKTPAAGSWNEFLLRWDANLSEQPAGAAANHLAASFWIVSFHQLSRKPVGSDRALPPWRHLFIEVTDWLSDRPDRWFKKNPTKNSFTIAVALCSRRIFFFFFLLIFQSGFVLFYGIDCLLAGSKVRQITSSLQGRSDRNLKIRRNSSSYVFFFFFRPQRGLSFISDWLMLKSSYKSIQRRRSLTNSHSPSFGRRKKNTHK